MPSNDFVLGLFAKEGAAKIICGGTGSKEVHVFTLYNIETAS